MPAGTTFSVTQHSVGRCSHGPASAACPYDATVTRHHTHAVLVPVKAFADAKARLAPVLDHEQRHALARWTADRVVAAAGELPVYVACDDDEVAAWASERGATVLWHPGVGLNAAVTRSVAQLAELAVDYVAVVHGDLPRSHALNALIVPDAICLVPDARRDGTNVLALATNLGFTFTYGAGSFDRHLSAAIASGQQVVVRRDSLLARDVDTPVDLIHPLVQGVLPNEFQ